MTDLSTHEALLTHTLEAEQRHFWFRGFRRFVRPLLARAAAGRTNLSLLDCGCGTGANLQLLAPYGTVFGFDVTRAGLEAAARHYGQTRLVQADVTRVPYRSSQFDIVTCFDVLVCLDHEQEAMALSEFARVLKPGGALVLNVAALTVLRGIHSVNAGEIRRYRRREMRAALSAAGFVADRLTYTNATLFPLVLVMRTFQRAMGLPSPEEESSNQLEVPVAPINTLFSSVLAVESVLVRCMDMPVGSSLLVLARKPS